MDFPSRPLLSDATLAKFEEVLKPKFRVVEQGSGGSTIWLAQRVEFLISFERDRAWVDATNRQLELLGLHNKAKSVYAAGRELEPIELAGAEPVDLVFVDGWIGDRTPFALAMMKYLKPRGWIVIDNTLCNDILEYKLLPVLEALRSWGYFAIPGFVEGRPNASTFWRKPEGIVIPSPPGWNAHDK